MPILVHLLIMAIILVVAVMIVLQGLKVYTYHNKAVIIPDVKGLSVEDAAEFFENNGLHFDVVDSVYSKEYAPGVIVEMVPSVGSKVKEGRIVFITINAYSVQKATVPDVADLSHRQALALIQSKGFTSVEIKHVPGLYKDLAIGIELNGKRLQPGELIPLSSDLSLVVNDGSSDDHLNPEENNSVDTIAGGSEEWF